jgi:NAD(P)-dependent dehydrogenase (short-subunit alcohol dehydrogenase family)
MKSVVITGVSTGIGWGCAKVLIAKGLRVFGSVRKEADAQRLKAEFGSNFVPLIFDVTDEAAVRHAAIEVDAALAGETLAGLVNNAGIAKAGPLLHLPIEELREQLEINLVGQVIVTQAFAPLLGAEAGRKDEKGRIVMISSVGGTTANPFMGPYNASKFGIEGLSESLRRELMVHGIDVIIVAPGAIATPIWDKAEEIDTTRYGNTAYASSLDRIKEYMLALGRKGLKPEVLGDAVWKALTVAKPRTRYVVTPDRLEHFLVNHLPKRTVDNIIAGRLGLKNRT